MPSMTVPLFTPSVTVTSMVFGDLDGSSLCVPTWITSSPFLTVCLRPSKVRMRPFKLADRKLRAARFTGLECPGALEFPDFLLEIRLFVRQGAGPAGRGEPEGAE